MAEKIIEVKEGVWSILVGTIVKEVDAKRRPKVMTKYDDAADASSAYQQETKLPNHPATALPTCRPACLANLPNHQPTSLSTDT